MAQTHPAHVPASEPVIRAEALTHRFGDLTAVDRVDLAVPAGEVYGFLGRNGAGKTTLIRALLGILTPTSGSVSLFGTAVRGGRTPASVWARVGYLVEGPGLYPELTVREHLRVAARYRGLGRAAVDDVIARLALEPYAGVRARVLSLGNRQRLGLALALVHRPPLVILDEPANGLDPAGVVEIRHLLRGLADGGVTVFMSSHIIGEVAKLADRVGIIHAGRLVAELGAEQLAASGQERLTARFRTPDLADRAAAALRAQGVDVVTSGAALTSTAPAAVERPDTIAGDLVRAGAAPTYLAVEREDLEGLFLRLTEGIEDTGGTGGSGPGTTARDAA